jgi:excisionase family DNA binding protein
MPFDSSLKLTDREIESVFVDAETASRFPPILSLAQAAELLGVPIGTLRDWRSRGKLGSCCRRIGKHVRFYRNRLIKHVFNDHLDD